MFFGKSKKVSIRRVKRRWQNAAPTTVITMQGASYKPINEEMTCAALNDKWKMINDNLESEKGEEKHKKWPCEVKKWGVKHEKWGFFEIALWQPF